MDGAADVRSRYAVSSCLSDLEWVVKRRTKVVKSSAPRNLGGRGWKCEVELRAAREDRGVRRNQHST